MDLVPGTKDFRDSSSLSFAYLGVSYTLRSHVRPQQIQAHNLDQAASPTEKQLLCQLFPTRLGPDLHRQDWVICPSCFPGHCHPMVSCSLSFSYILIPHRELVAAPGAHLCHWGTKGDSRAPSGTVSPQNNATIPLHFAAALLCWHRSCGAEFQTGSRAQALSAFSFLNQSGVSDFVPHLSLGQELAQR